MRITGIIKRIKIRKYYLFINGYDCYTGCLRIPYNKKVLHFILLNKSRGRKSFLFLHKHRPCPESWKTNNAIDDVVRKVTFD